MKNLKTKLRSFLNRFWPVALILLAVLIFFYPVWIKHLVPIPGDFIVGTYFPWLDYKWGNIVGVAVKNPITSDVVSINYPLRSLAMDLVKSGKIPLWNSDMFAGYPLLANIQIAIFSPTILLYFFLPILWAWTGQVILQPFLAAFFTYLFLRHLKLSKLSSVFGGLVYAFSGFNLIWMEWNERTLVAAFIPLILLVVDKILVEKKFIFALFLSILVALQFFSGYPQLIIYTGVACLILIIFKIRNLDKKVFGLFVLSIVLGLLLTSIQFLPALELLTNSQRVTELLTKDLIYFPWRNLITFIAPDFFGNHATGNFWGIGDYTNNVGYSGVISLTLAIIAMVHLFKKTEIKYFLTLLFISLLLALENPISTFIWKSGLLGSAAASNTRALVLVNFCLAGLSAFAVDLIIKTKKKISLIPNLSILLIVMLIFLLTFVLRKVSPSLILQNDYLIGLRNLVQPFILVLFATMVLIIRNFYFSSTRARFFTAFLLIVLSVLELFRFGWKYTPFSKTEYVFPETPVINYLQNLKKPTRVLPGNVIPMNMWVPYGLESISGYTAAYPESIAKYIGVSNSGNINASAQGRYGTLALFTSKLTDIANGEYLLLNNKDIGEYYKNLIVNGRLMKVFTDKSVTIYKKAGALPRAIVVTNWSVSSGTDILGKLLDPNFNPAKEIILEKQPSIPTSSETNINSVNYLSYSSDKSLIEVSTQKQGFLFVSDTWYPGWQAYVDGKESEILRADYAFQAVAIPAGLHKVTFIYDPKSFRIGEWVSLGALILLLCLFLYEIRIGKKSKS